MNVTLRLMIILSESLIASESMALCSYCCSLVKGLKERSFKYMLCYTFLILWRKLYVVVAFTYLKPQEGHKINSLEVYAPFYSRLLHYSWLWGKVQTFNSLFLM